MSSINFILCQFFSFHASYSFVSVLDIISINLLYNCVIEICYFVFVNNAQHILILVYVYVNGWNSNFIILSLRRTYSSKTKYVLMPLNSWGKLYIWISFEGFCRIETKIGILNEKYIFSAIYRAWRGIVYCLN